MRSGKTSIETSMQRVKNISWYPYRIPLRARFTTAHGVLTRREGAIVEICTEDGLSGCGEIAPLPAFAGDDLETALAPLPMLSARLRAKTLAEALDLLYASVDELPASTTCGLESALLDAIGRHTDRSVSTIIASAEAHCIASDDSSSSFSPKCGIPVNAVIGSLPLDSTITRAHEFVAAGFHCIKLKMGADPEQEIARVAAIRSAVGPSIHLRLDANESWTFDQAVIILSRAAAYDLQYVEQPLPAGDLEGMRKLRHAVPIPIAADESVSNIESARRVLAHAAADILILKPQLVGGLRAGQQVIREAAARGVQCVITSAIEAGIGLTGAAHLAATPEVTLECGLATLSLLADDLLLDGLPIHNGVLAVPAGPGLGVSLDRAALARYRADEASPHPTTCRRDHL